MGFQQGFRINTNTASLDTYRSYTASQAGLERNIERLSSGLRINRAADDAAGLAVSEGMRAELVELRQAVKNAEQATNLIQTGEGALNEVNAMLIRMKELAMQSASSTMNNDNRQSINAEFVQLINEIDRIAVSTSYNNITLLTGYGNVVSGDSTVSTALQSTTTGVVGAQISGATSGTYIFSDAADDREITLGNGVITQTIDIGPALDADAVGGVVATGSSIIANFDRLGILITLDDRFRDGGLNNTTLQIDAGTGGSFQIGPDNRVVDRIQFGLDDMRASGTQLNLNVTSIATLTSARNSIPTLDLAINRVASERGEIGAIQNRLSFTISSANNAIENIQASESSIRDADVAEEISEFTRSQILTQAATAVLAQANAIPQSALSLLQ